MGTSSSTALAYVFGNPKKLKKMTNRECSQALFEVIDMMRVSFRHLGFRELRPSRPTSTETLILELWADVVEGLRMKHLHTTSAIDFWVSESGKILAIANASPMAERDPTFHWVDEDFIVHLLNEATIDQQVISRMVSNVEDMFLDSIERAEERLRHLEYKQGELASISARFRGVAQERD